MHITNTSFSLQSALEAMPVISGLLGWHKCNYPAAAGAAYVASPEEWPAELGVDGELLLLKLPDDLEPQLQALAEVPLNDYNRVSADLLSKTTFIALQTEEAVVEFDAWGTRFPTQARRFFIALIAGGSFVLSCRELDVDEADAFIGGLQGTCISSGPNYRPYDYWTEEQVRAAAEGRFVPYTCDDELTRRTVACVTVCAAERKRGAWLA